MAVYMDGRNVPDRWSGVSNEKLKEMVLLNGRGS
jgi:hypothetical protein